MTGKIRIQAAALALLGLLLGLQAYAEPYFDPNGGEESLLGFPFSHWTVSLGLPPELGALAKAPGLREERPAWLPPLPSRGATQEELDMFLNMRGGFAAAGVKRRLRVIHLFPWRSPSEDFRVISAVSKRPEFFQSCAELLFAIADERMGKDANYDPSEIRACLIAMKGRGPALGGLLFRSEEEGVFLAHLRGDKSCLPALQKMLGDPSKRLRAIFCIGEFGKQAEPALGAVKGFLNDANMDVKAAAVTAALKISPEDKEASALLAELVKSGGPAQIERLLPALALRPSPERLKIILECWGSRGHGFSPHVKPALSTLEALSEEALPTVFDCLKEDGGTFLWTTLKPFIVRHASASIPLTPSLLNAEAAAYAVKKDVLKTLAALKAKASPPKIEELLPMLLFYSEAERRNELLKLLMEINPDCDVYCAYLLKNKIFSTLPASTQVALIAGASKERPKDLAKMLAGLFDPTSGAMETNCKIISIAECVPALAKPISEKLSKLNMAPPMSETLKSEKERLAKIASGGLQPAKWPPREFSFQPLAVESKMTEEERLKTLEAFKNHIMAPAGFSIHPQNAAAFDKYASLHPEVDNACLLFMLANVNVISDELALKYLAKCKGLMAKGTPELRKKAVLALALCAKESCRKPVMELLFGALQDPDPDVVSAACESLGRLGASVQGDLCAALDSGADPFVAVASCRLLGERGSLGLEAAPALAKALSSSKEWSVREAAASALGSLGPAPGSIDALKKALDDESRQVQKASACALALLGGVEKGDPALAKIAERAFLNEPTPFYEAFKAKVMEGLK